MSLLKNLSDGLETRVPPLLSFSLRVKTLASGEKLKKAILATEALVELTTKLASVWASAVDCSDSMMYCKPC